MEDGFEKSLPVPKSIPAGILLECPKRRNHFLFSTAMAKVISPQLPHISTNISTYSPDIV
jgi:hypothetical protein